MPKSDAERQKTTRERKKKAGYIWAGFWIKPTWKKEIVNSINKLKQKDTTTITPTDALP